jgi:ATP phosphoribosyltransferase
MLTFALSKGRIFDETLPLLKRAGIEVLDDPETSRKLILSTNRADVLMESEGDGLYRPLDLRIARCRMSVATRSDFDYANAVKQGSRIRVATKYTATARQFFADKGVHVDLIKLYGSMELAPLTGLADAIVDLVSSGNTLKANGLIEVEKIADISSRLVVNQAALKLKREAMRPLIDALERAVQE